GKKTGTLEEFAASLPIPAEADYLCFPANFFQAYDDLAIIGGIYSQGQTLYNSWLNFGCGFDASGKLHLFTALTPHNKKLIINKNGEDVEIVTAFNCFPWLIKDGEKLDLLANAGDSESFLNQRAQRAFMGQTADGTFMYGMVPRATIFELQEICESLGLINATNTDGGASAGAYRNGKYIARPGRELASVVFIVESADGAPLPAAAEESKALPVGGLSAGSEHTMYIHSDGSLWGWGVNSYGQVGDGTKENRAGPVEIMDDVIFVSAGKSHTLAIKKDGGLWAWGSNSNGQLGNGAATQYSLEGDGNGYEDHDSAAPIHVMDEVAWAAAGCNYSMAVKTDGTLWVWGDNNKGQLGDGTAVSHLSPFLLMKDVKKVFASTEPFISPAILKTDGSLWTWTLQSPALDKSKATAGYLPEQVLTSVETAACGEFHMLAIKTDGSLWAWGGNNDGALGDGTTTDRATPVKVMDTVAAVAANSHSMAVQADGSLWAWGYNHVGQVGNGETGSINSPAKIMDGGVAAVAAGRNRSLAVDDGGVWAWGRDSAVYAETRASLPLGDEAGFDERVWTA
ncbi:MAG: phosphodiester glycosidase family protein, partial [Clostridiales bacterium]|nr:phosphodiester glycosidase family protein [Clostridiales bacterium]